MNLHRIHCFPGWVVFSRDFELGTHHVQVPCIFFVGVTSAKVILHIIMVSVERISSLNHCQLQIVLIREGVAPIFFGRLLKRVLPLRSHEMKKGVDFPSLFRMSGTSCNGCI